MMVYRALLALSLVFCLTQALPVKKASDLTKELANAQVAKGDTLKRPVKRSEETVIIGNHQNAPREKKADPAVELKNEQNRDENGKIEVTEKELDKSEIVSDNEEESPLSEEAMETAVMELAKAAEATPKEGASEDTADDRNKSDLEELIKVVEEEKELDNIPKENEVIDKVEEEDVVFQPQDIFNLAAHEKEVNDVNSAEVPDQESEVTDTSEEEKMPQQTDEYQYDDYNSLYTDPYQWLDRKKRNVDRQKRETALQGSEAGMSMAANEEDTKSRSKRDTEYPLSLNDLYNLYYKYKELKDEEEQADLEPVYELPEYEEDYPESPEYDYGVGEIAPPAEEWEPEAVNNEIQKELMLEAMMEPAAEAEAPYYLADESPEEEVEEMEEQELPAWEVPAESAYYPMEYEPVARPEAEDIYIPDKRAEMLSMMPGIKRADDFYPAYTEEQEPWQALIPPAAEKRGVMEEYARLYRLARALKRSREDSVEERWDGLLGGYDEKKK